MAKVALTLLVVTLGGSGLAQDADGHIQDSTMPADLRVLFDSGDYEAIPALTSKRLREHIGEPFPNLLLHGRKKRNVQLHDVVTSRTVLFFAATDYTGSVKMAKELRENGWEVPGYEQILTLVVTLDVPNLRKQLPSLRDAYVTEWPFPSYLAYCRGYPALLFLSADGTFEGFQIGNDGERVFE